MTKKDDILIAEVLKNTDLPGNLRDVLALNFAAALKRENPRFQPVRFCIATMPKAAAKSEFITTDSESEFITATRTPTGFDIHEDRDLAKAL